MIQQIKMPSAGQTTDASRIGAVLVKVGDSVKRGDVLLEAETDKATLPVESFAAGVVLDVLVEEGDDVTAGDVLVVVGSRQDMESYGRSGDSPAPEPDAPAVEAELDDYRPIIPGAPSVQAAPASPLPAPAQAYPAMPNAKLLAREKQVDLSRVVPANGMVITRKDVLAAPGDGGEYRVLPMSRIRSIIARRMTESAQSIPAWQCAVTIDMEAAMALRSSYREHKGISFSYNDMIAKAVATASEQYPLIRSRYEEGEVRVYSSANIGFAVALEEALVVPVIKNVEKLSLWEIAARGREQVEKARNNALLPEDMGCGSATISNLGMFDVDFFTAMINPPESCILAVGRIDVKPRWDGNGFRPVHQMTVTGSFDHRIIDGAYGARFLRELKMLLEHPALMLN